MQLAAFSTHSTDPTQLLSLSELHPPFSSNSQTSTYDSDPARPAAVVIKKTSTCELERTST